MRGNIFIILVFAFFVSSICAQNSSDRADSNFKAEFLAAFKKMKTVEKIRIISETNINNKLLADQISEYVAPNKYYRLLKKSREGKKIEFEGIEIAGQHFEKIAGKWIKEKNPVIVLKDEIDLIRSPKFESSKKDAFKIISLDVEYLSEENSDGEISKIYKYTLIDELLPTEGKVWIKNGLPVRLESSTLPGCLNLVTSKVKYDYDAEIIIQKPQPAQK